MSEAQKQPARRELVALRWRDIDFPGQAIRVRANYSHGELVTPKSGKIRSVPMIPEVAQALARLSQRELFMGDEDPSVRRAPFAPSTTDALRVTNSIVSD